MEQTIPKPVQLKMAFFLDVCSGLSAPLSTALQGKNRAILRPVDSHPRAGGHDHDISRPKVVDFLIRLGKSGVVRMAHGAPPCSKYSKLRNRPGGPPPVRSQEHMDGLPSNTPEMQAEADLSRTIHKAVIDILFTIWLTGGHVSYEQPPSALSQFEPFVIQFLRCINALQALVHACMFEPFCNDPSTSYFKEYLFSFTYPPLQALSRFCVHGGWDAHPSFAGVKNASGDWASSDTAEYPEGLARVYADIIAPLLDVTAENTEPREWQSVLDMIPKKTATVGKQKQESRMEAAYHQRQTGVYHRRTSKTFSRKSGTNGWNVPRDCNGTTDFYHMSKRSARSQSSLIWKPSNFDTTWLSF